MKPSILKMPVDWLPFSWQPQIHISPFCIAYSMPMSN